MMTDGIYLEIHSWVRVGRMVSAVCCKYVRLSVVYHSMYRAIKVRLLLVYLSRRCSQKTRRAMRKPKTPTGNCSQTAWCARYKADVQAADPTQPCTPNPWKQAEKNRNPRARISGQDRPARPAVYSQSWSFPRRQTTRTWTVGDHVEVVAVDHTTSQGLFPVSRPHVLPRRRSVPR